MKPHFLFPASPLNPRVVDEAFSDQAEALKAAGFGTSVIDDEGSIRPKPEEGATIVYRGWMMNAEEYWLMISRVAGYGFLTLTSPKQYLATHHIPNWYPLLAKYTPETVCVPNGSPLPELGWDKFQIKDYVKSLKTAGGSVATKPEEVAEILANMTKYRGTIEGGVCFRRWEEFSLGSEKRYFVINGRYYSQDFGYDLRHMRILARVHDVVPSPFYSVDIAQPKDSDLEARLVEIGDGQVSDLVGWTPERFAQIWKEAYA